MTCAFSVTPNAESETPMSALIRALALTIGVLCGALISTASFGAEVLKFSYVTTIYSDLLGSDQQGSDQQTAGQQGAGQQGTDQQQSIALKNPQGVGCDDQSGIMVADTGNGRLLRYQLRDKTAVSGSPAMQVPELPYPTRVHLNSRGEIFALDRKARRIVRLTPKGAFNGYLEPSGLPSAAFVPRSFCIDRNDAIYILDILSERIVVVDAEGRYREQKKFPKDYGFFSDVTVDFKGAVFLIDSINATVFAADKEAATFAPLTANLKEYMRFPTAITTDERGHMYLVDHNGSRVIILGSDGSFLGRLSAMGWKEGLLNHPSQLCINRRGEIFIADTDNNRVQVFALKE
jgi:sugar lactone lactonase YvrE